MSERLRATDKDDVMVFMQLDIHMIKHGPLYNDVKHIAVSQLRLRSSPPICTVQCVENVDQADASALV